MSYVKIKNLIIGSNERTMLTAVNDMGSGSVNKRSESFYGFDGCIDSDITFAPRTVSVSGTLFGDSMQDIDGLKRTLSEACNPKEEIELCYNNGYKSYYSPAYAEGLPTFSKLENKTYRFVIYFKLYKFWWYGPLVSRPVMKRADNVYGTFSLPRALTVSTIGAIIQNGGTAAAEPIFKIKFAKARTADFAITNATYQKHIKIESYSVAAGEILTVNCGDCSVTSDVNGNIIEYLSEDSTFFNIEVGKNDITFSGEDEASVEYREKYIGA